MRLALADMTSVGAGLILVGLTGCQNSTSALQPSAEKQVAAQTQTQSAPQNTSQAAPQATPQDTKAVSVRDGITQAINLCGNQGPRFEKAAAALKKAGYKLGAATSAAKGGTTRQALSSDGKFIVKLDTASNGFKSCRVLFRSNERTPRTIARAIAADGRLAFSKKRGDTNPYRVKATGHPVAVNGPLKSATSREVGVLFTVSQLKKS